MHGEMVRQALLLEYQALAVVGAPLTSLAVTWVVRQVLLHLRDRRAAAYAARLVAWAEQAIPARSARYAEVAALLSRRFPMFSGEQLEVLIESEVLSLKTALRAAPASAAVATTATATATGRTATVAAAVAVTAPAPTESETGTPDATSDVMGQAQAQGQGQPGLRLGAMPAAG